MIAGRSTTAADPTPAAIPAATPAVMDAYDVIMNRYTVGVSEPGTVKLTCTLGHLGSWLVE